MGVWTKVALILSLHNLSSAESGVTTLHAATPNFRGHILWGVQPSELAVVEQSLMVKMSFAVLVNIVLCQCRYHPLIVAIDSCPVGVVFC